MIYQENAPDNQARSVRRATLDRPKREARLSKALSTDSPCPTTEEVDRAKPEAVEPIPLFLILRFPRRRRFGGARLIALLALSPAGQRRKSPRTR